MKALQKIPLGLMHTRPKNANTIALHNLVQHKERKDARA